MQINFINLAQISLDFAKNVQSLITCINKKKSKKKRSFDYTPPVVKEVKEEEILAIKAIVNSSATKLEITIEATIEANIANILLKHVSFY